MIKILSADDKSRKIIRETAQLVSENNGFINQHLQIKVSGAELRLVAGSRKLTKGDKLFSLPVKCMPILSDFNYELHSGVLKAIPKEGRTISALHKELMKYSVELYNIFDKVESFAKVSPAVQLSSNERLCARLLKLARIEILSRNALPSLDDLKILAYWHTRAYHDAYSSTDRLIPLVEFLDHHAFANGFYESNKEDNRLLDVYFEPIAGIPKGVYVSYSLMDALEAYVKYGFLDKSAFFVKSKPFVFEMPGAGPLKINNLDIKSNQLPPQNWLWLPKHKSNAQFYAPRVAIEDDGQVTLSFALIPPVRHIKAIQEVFEHQFSLIEKLLEMKAGVLNNPVVIDKFKRQLVKENKRDYKELYSEVINAQLDESAVVTKTLLQVLSYQMKIINSFEKAAF